MNRLRDWMAQPSLVKRSTWSVLMAFVVVWAVLLAYEYGQNRHALATGPGRDRRRGAGPCHTGRHHALDQRAARGRQALHRPL
jgi:hypothetical protein